MGEMVCVKTSMIKDPKIKKQKLIERIGVLEAEIEQKKDQIMLLQHEVELLEDRAQHWVIAHLMSLKNKYLPKLNK